MAAKPKLTPEQWADVRNHWEHDPRDGYSWLVDELGLPVSAPGVRKTALRDERSYAASLAQGLYSGRDYAWLARYDAAIARVDAAQATRALRKYLADAPLVWSVGRGD